MQVQSEDSAIRVSGERKTAGSESTFLRSFSIDPETVDVENVQANLEFGVLTSTAPMRNKPTVTKTITATEAPLAFGPTERVYQQKQVVTSLRVANLSCNKCLSLSIKYRTIAHQMSLLYIYAVTSCIDSDLM